MSMNLFFGIKYYLTPLMVVLTLICNGQTAKLDSLEKAFLTTSTPVEKGEILKKIYTEVQHVDLDKALVIAIEIRNLSVQANQENTRLGLDALNLLGNAYLNMNQSDSAFYYFKEVIRGATKQSDSLFLSKGNNNIGIVLANQGSFSQAAYYFNVAAQIDIDRGDLSEAIVSYLNIGTLYQYSGNLDSARYFLNKAQEGANAIKDKNLLATAFLNLGTVDLRATNYNDARQNFFKAIDLAESIEGNILISMAYRNLAKLYMEQNKYKIAIEYDLKSLEYAMKSDELDGAKSAYLGLAVSYENLGLYKEAYHNHKEYTALIDTIRARENQQTLIEMQTKFRSEQTMIENQLLIQKSEIQDLEIAKGDEELANSRIVIISSILGLILLVILAFTLYNRNLIRQKANLKLREANEIINEKNKDIMASIEYASKIQEALLPTKDNQKLFKDSFYLLQPKDIVSGDFFWYAEVEDVRIVAVIDCTGHGVPGAFMSMIGNTFLHEIVNEKKIARPDLILHELRTRVIRALNQKGDGTNRKDGMDMAICAVNQKGGLIEFAGANNPVYMVINGEILEIKGDKQPVGYFHGEEAPFTLHTVKVAMGDCAYIFSDGFADQFGGPKGKKFKYKQLRDLIFANHLLPMQEQKKILLSTFDTWKGELEQVDDVCMIGIRI